MHGMDWDGMRVFLAVARAGRVSAAAKRLNVEHTTVSRRLVALEADLGVPLFYRTTTGYLLTPHGQNVLTNAEAMERAALAVSGRAREASDAPGGVVRIALAPEFASHWVAGHLASFRAKHPDIELQLLVGTRQRDLSRGEAELSVQTPRPRQQTLVAVRLAATATALYASKTFLGHRRLKIAGGQSARGLPLLTFTAAFPLLQEAAWYHDALAAAAVVVRTNSTHALLEAARAGVGVALLPRFVARAYPDLVAVSDHVAQHDLWLITHPDFRRDPKVRAASDFLRRIAGGLD